MCIAFSICANNYLAQVKTLAYSILKHNPCIEFLLFIADKPSGLIHYEDLPFKVIFLDQLLDQQTIHSLCNKYNIVELAASLKASTFKYVLNNYKEGDKIFFFDPDIKTYESLRNLEEELNTSSILLTPHILTSIEYDCKSPAENTFLKFGIYNAGFIGLKRSAASSFMLDWWEEKLLNECFDDIENGIFCDQLWLNLVPLFFKETKILKESGYNMAPWNLHERSLKKIDDQHYLVNGSGRLVFFHFSSFNVINSNKFPYYYNRFNINNRPDLIDLFNGYASEVLKNKYYIYSKIPCAYKLKPLKKNIYARLIQRLLNHERTKNYSGKEYSKSADN